MTRSEERVVGVFLADVTTDFVAETAFSMPTTILASIRVNVKLYSLFSFSKQIEFWGMMWTGDGYGLLYRGGQNGRAR